MQEAGSSAERRGPEALGRLAPEEERERRMYEAVVADAGDSVSALLDAGASPDAEVSPPQGGQRCTALWHAAKQDSAAVATLLLQAGADPDRADPYGVTPLTRASMEGSAATVTVLLRAGADSSLQTNKGLTAAEWAARKDHLPIAAEIDDWSGKVTQVLDVGGGDRTQVCAELAAEDGNVVRDVHAQVKKPNV